MRYIWATLIAVAYCCWLDLLSESLVKSEGYQPLCLIITTKSRQNDTANEKNRKIKDEWGQIRGRTSSLQSWKSLEGGNMGMVT